MKTTKKALSRACALLKKYGIGKNDCVTVQGRRLAGPWLSIEVPGATDTGLFVTVRLYALTAAVKSAPNGELEITANALVWAHGTADIGDTYADVEPVEQRLADIPHEPLCAIAPDACRFVAYAMSTNSFRPNLNGGYIEYSADGAWSLTATDGHRLAQYGECMPKKRVVTAVFLPAPIINWVAQCDSPASIYRVGSGFCAVVGGDRLFAGGTDCKYPDYRQVLPGGEAKKATIPDGFLENLTLPRKEGAVLQFSENATELNAKGVRQSFPAIPALAGVILDARYLKDAVDHGATELCVYGPLAPVVFSHGSEGWSVIMPRRE